MICFRHSRTSLVLPLLVLASCGAPRDRSDIAQETAARGSESSDTDATGNNDGAKLVINSIGLQLVRIPAGQFKMGSSPSDPDSQQDEMPAHVVHITRPFYLGVYEVTQHQVRQVLGENRSFFSPTGGGKQLVECLDTDRLPAEQMTWKAAVRFCQKLSSLPAERQAGRRYRLPTEAEWEYACRAGVDTAFHFGDSLSATQANFNSKYPFGDAPAGEFLAHTTEVGTFQANAFGLYDMHGNVWEWCSDWYGREYYKHSPSANPPGPADGSVRVIRGGDWYSDARDCRSAFRYADLPDGIFYATGMRVMMTPVDSETDIAVEAEPARQPSGTESELAPQVTEPPPTSRAGGGGEDWPRWRGPRGDGTWRGPKLPNRWPQAGLRRLWQQPVGGGYAGIVATQSRVLTMDRQSEPQEVERVLCFDIDNGQLLWSHKYPVRYGDLSYGTGPRTTPTVVDDRVFTLGAMGDIHCLELATGRVRWTKNLVTEFGARVPIWGFSSHPLCYKDLVVVVAGVEANASLVALDQDTGRLVWKTLSDPAGYATPILVQRPAGAQLLYWTPRNICAVHADTGESLWSIPWEVTNGTSIATPIFQEQIMLATGYYDGSQAIRLREDPRQAEVQWEDHRNLRGLMSQPLYRDGHVYLLDRRNGLTCFHLQTGKTLWNAGNRLTPKGRNPHATLVWLGDEDRAIALNSEGELILAHLRPSGYHEQSRTKIIGPTWSHPAYAGWRVMARDDQQLVCVSLVEAKPGVPP